MSQLFLPHGQGTPSFGNLDVADIVHHQKEALYTTMASLAV